MFLTFLTDKHTLAVASLVCAACLPAPAAAQISVTGSDKPVIQETPDANTGLTSIYVVYDTHGTRLSYTATAGAGVAWQSFGSAGAAHAQPLTPTADGATTWIDLGPGDSGYVITEGTRSSYVWVVDYTAHHARLDDLSPAPEQDCDRTRLRLDGDAGPITYYTINGAPRTLSRDLSVTYATLAYDEASGVYNQIEAERTLASVDGSFSVPAPLCDTRFTISGDRFLKSWGLGQHAESGTYTATAVEARTTATQELRENDNEQTVEGGSLGGSAPVEIHFRAAVTDAAIFREWQMSRDPEFEVIDDRFPQLDLDYTFRDNGTTYVRFVANNAQGTCEYLADTYDVFVGESALLCPNAFSPDGDGVNDEWKVSYKSIISFECHIFNRWGQELASMTDPAIGWDGRHGGKIVPTGVYYYVIRATGSDGRKYNLSGDINILHKKSTPLPASPES